MVSVVSQLAQIVAGVACAWAAWQLRVIPGYRNLLACLSFSLLATGLLGVSSLDDLTAVMHWRQPLFILQRSLLVPLVVFVVMRNKGMRRAAGAT